MKTTITRRTPAKTRTRNFFDHRSILQASSSHNHTEYKQVATRPRRTMHGTPRYGDNVMADIVDGSVVRSYITPMLDQNVSMTVNDGVDNPVYYYNQNERQSVVNLTDDTGVVVNDYAYSAYGDKVDSLTGGSVEQRYTYTSRELSDTTGDFYFRYRWYGAGVGGFDRRDPIKYRGGGMSLYVAYFGSFLTIDPFGLEPPKKGTPKPPAKKHVCTLRKHRHNAPTLEDLYPKILRLAGTGSRVEFGGKIWKCKATLYTRPDIKSLWQQKGKAVEYYAVQNTWGKGNATSITMGEIIAAQTQHEKDAEKVGGVKLPRKNRTCCYTHYECTWTGTVHYHPNNSQVPSEQDAQLIPPRGFIITGGKLYEYDNKRGRKVVYPTKNRERSQSVQSSNRYASVPLQDL